MRKSTLTVTRKSKYIGIFALLLSTIPTLVNNPTLAQIPSIQSQCTEVEIKKYIQQLDKAEISDFDALVACQSKSVPALINTLNSRDESIRIIAIAALGKIGINAASAVPALNVAYKDKSIEVRVVTVDALGKIRKRAIPTLIAALQDENEDVRKTATNALVKIGKPALPALIKALETGSWKSRLAVADVLGKMHSNAKKAVPAMIRTFGKSLTQESEICLAGFYYALNNIGTDILPELNAALKDKDWKVRVGAIASFKIITNHSNVVPTLTKIFLDEKEDIRVRYTAVKVLSNLESEQAISVLKQYQKTADVILQKAKAINFQFPYCITAGTDSVAKATATASSKQRPMCRIPSVRALLWWKCPK
jgi:HEAT repeat protein